MKFFRASVLIMFYLVLPVGAQRKNAGVTELVIYPASISTVDQKLELLFPENKQVDEDAAKFYEAAFGKLPSNLQTRKLMQLAKSDFKELPLHAVEKTIEELKPALQSIEEAARCKSCSWPSSLNGNLNKYRDLACALALQSRLNIAAGRHAKAAESIQVCLGMARHLSQATLVHGLTGISCAALMCDQMEQFIQGPDSPSLYASLAILPKPLIDLTVSLEAEQDEDAREKIGRLMQRLDRHIAALQNIEALRSTAAKTDGKFPAALSDTLIEVPNDPVTGKPFIYTQTTGSRASLKSPVTAYADQDKPINFVLILMTVETKENP